MDSLERVLALLASSRSWGYHHDSVSATEPAALTAMALVAHGRAGDALPIFEWLLGQQAGDGTLAVETGQNDPHWATGLAVLAWQIGLDCGLENPKYAPALEKSIHWILHTEGMGIERSDWKGHDTTLRGWPWVEGTHSWLEPTAINLLALEKTGRGDHPRGREAARMLHDRLLPGGGCNYGNTVVFGQELRAHLQPSGMCLLALAGRSGAAPRVPSTIDYIQRELNSRTTTASLCYSLLGLAAWQRAMPEADAWLSASAGRVIARDPASYKLALLALAALGPDCPLIPGPIAARPASSQETEGATS